jgi:hypothetical protein
MTTDPRTVEDVLGPVPGLREPLGARLRRVLSGRRRGPTIVQSFGVWGGALGRWWGGRGPRFKRSAGVLAIVLVLGSATVAYLALRPVPKPDYTVDDLGDVFNYTLLTDEFNKLPVEERLALMGQLVQRLKSMSAEDSMLLAAFAQGIAGAARDQIEVNASRLAIDVWDKYAKDYAKVPEAERAAYLDKTFVAFSKMMETVAGDVRDISDEERVAEARENAARERERLKDPDRQPSGEELGRFFGFMNNTVGGRASPQERVRGQTMMRDMVRHFRGQDIRKGPG